MSSGGGGSQTVTQTNISKSAEPFYKQLLKSTGQNIFDVDQYGKVTGIKGYQPYAGGDVNARVAGFNPNQRQVFNETMGLGTPEEYGYASQGAGTGSSMGFNLANRGLNAAFGPTQNYMSNYIQGALDPQIREINRQADYNKRNDALQSMRSGAFSGSRSALMAAERERNATQAVGDVLGKGYQTAFEQAQREKEYLGNLGLQGLQQGLTGSELLGKLGSARQQADLDRLKAQGAVGSQEQQLEQQKLDALYQAAMEGRDWDKSQLQFFSDIMRGNAGALGSQTVSYNKSNPLTQAAGLGVAGLGAYLRGS